MYYELNVGNVIETLEIRVYIKHLNYGDKIGRDNFRKKKEN